MKKVLIIICCLLLLTGCKKDNASKIQYDSYIKELKTIKESSNNIPFNIEIKIDRLTDDKLIYQFIIDEVKEDIFDIEALVIHNKKTEDVFPSIGIFDDKESLKLNKKPKGIVLAGYIDYSDDINNLDITFKSIIKYKESNNKSHKVYYVTKNNK